MSWGQTDILSKVLNRSGPAKHQLTPWDSEEGDSSILILTER
jgi:hypothetical protein